MMKTTRTVLLVLLILCSSIAGSGAQKPEHVAWVVESLIQMQTVKPGMTRSDLLKVFTTEGGLSQLEHRRYVYRGCPYFKVDVDFKLVGSPDRERDGDIIKAISRPYLQFTIAD